MACLFIQFQHSSLPIRGREYCWARVCVCVRTPYTLLHFDLFTFDGTLKTYHTGSPGTAPDCMYAMRWKSMIYLLSLPNPLFFPAPQAESPQSSSAPTCSCSGAAQGRWRATAGCCSWAWLRPRHSATPACLAGTPAWPSRGCCCRSALVSHIIHSCDRRWQVEARR